VARWARGKLSRLRRERRDVSSSSLGLYLHIPFCTHICAYCNFNRGLLDEPLKLRYVRALEREIRGAGHGEDADTIYFGGGTPSLLEAEEVGRLIEACGDAFALSPTAEITLETNPETATAERLRAFRDAGVSRLSMGVQSFRDPELARLGRVHDAARARDAVAAARVAGFDNVSLDLMMWLPQQTVADWLESVGALIDVAPDHASLYLLELYPNAPLRDEMTRGDWSLAPDEDAAEMYLAGLERLDAAGYVQYEISNVAAPGHASRHNLKYWQDGEWLGLGCGAHSTRDGVRWRNVSAPADYVARIRADGDLVAERRVLTPRERVEEALITGLRLVDGVDLDELGGRYGADIWATYADALAPYVDAGHVVREGARLRLSRPGLLISQEILGVFV
jgi:oxygen-independent coproporphyrinogen-3 oxidase